MKKRNLILSGMLLLAVALAIVLCATRAKGPTGAAVGGAVGCGGEAVPESPATNPTLEAIVTQAYDHTSIVAALLSESPVLSLDGNLLSYLYSLYQFAGHDESFMVPSYEMVGSEEMADLYDGKYAPDSPHLPLGTVKREGNRFTIFLRSGITMVELLRAVHHELGDVLASHELQLKEIHDQYFSELNRLFMTVVSFAHLPDVGRLLVPDLAVPLPASVAELSNYQRGFMLAAKLLGENGMDLEAAHEVLVSMSLVEMDKMTQASCSGKPADCIADWLAGLASDNQFKLSPDYCDYLAAAVRLGAQAPAMVSAYGAGDKDGALGEAVALVQLMAPYPNEQFPALFPDHLLAYNVAALLYLDAGEAEGARAVTQAFWDRFEPYLTGKELRAMFQHRGPSTLFARTLAEVNSGAPVEGRKWAERTVSFEQWYDYSPGSEGGEAIARARKLLEQLPE